MTDTNFGQNVAEHYKRRHELRGDLFGDQPFANYGYWTRPDLSLAQAAEAMAQLVGASAGLSSRDRVLEVGCGYGACAVVYARCFRFASFTGIDLTDIRIEEGRKYVAQQGFSDLIKLCTGDATHLDFADASFDKLMAVECAFHFDTRRDFMREAARVLTSGGVLVLTDLIARRGKDLATYNIVDKKISALQLQLYNPANAYDADTYAGYLREAGFTDVRIESILEWTLRPFIPSLHRYADRLPKEEGEKIRNHAERLSQLIEAGGEDYVLVTARKR